MNNIYFPNDERDLDFVMEIYESEIKNRRIWMKEVALQLNKIIKSEIPSPSIAIFYASSIVSQAMLILRLIDKEAISARKANNEKKKSKERAKIIHERNPDLPEAPNDLRRIRNNYEHFEAKLDEWATTPRPKSYIDLNMVIGTAPMIGGGFHEKDVFRSLENMNLKFWNREVNLQEVADWVNQVGQIIEENGKQ
jgi:hypothetical protein